MSSNNQNHSVSIDSADWAAQLPDSEHSRFFTKFKWEETDIGALATWGIELRLYTLQAFSDDRPVCIWWGPQKVAIYNECYRAIAGTKHPAALGSTFLEVFPEVADAVIPSFEKAEYEKKTAYLNEVPLTIIQNQFIEERFFSASFVPLLLLDGSVGGLHNAPEDITRQKLSDRRSQMLNRISTLSDQWTSTTVFRHIAQCFDTNRLDVPFALLFKVEHEAEDGNHELALVENLGLPPNIEVQTQHLKLNSQDGFMPFLHAAQTEIQNTSVHDTFAGIKMGDVIWGGHGVQSQYLTTLSLSSAGRTYGFLVVGNNPRQPIDHQYDQFIFDLQRHATAAVAATIGAEERQARNDRLQIQLIESERQIRYMAQHSDIGMIQLALDGTLIWANEHYRSAINNEDDHNRRGTFIAEKQLLAEDYNKATNAWLQVLQGRKAEVTELRLRREYTPPNGDSIPSTILLSAFPYIEEGQVKSVMACMTDVSRLKWAESWQAQVARDASEAKRQQSEFTDAISHEVRNPLSVILQLADSITDSFNGLQDTVQDCMKRLEENVEAAKTILNCAQHQKRIVDDVLTLSYMDFTSMSLSPIPVRPDDLISEALRLVEADAAAGRITLRTVAESSSVERNLERVMCDSLRVTQVLVNLMSNAIKFTRRETERVITITYGATSTSPIGAFPQHIVWAPHRRNHGDATLGPEWGNGEHSYLTFLVEDTGPGMTSEQMKRIFERFEQATPKTSIKYGGSGLGLFISHSLIERQSGRIGASSTPGSGSTFAFYVKIRRVQEFHDPGMNGLPLADNQRRSRIGGVESQQGLKGLSQSQKKTEKRVLSSTYHILLVEDNLINQQVLRKQLTKIGCTVHVANNGLEALTFLRNSSLWTENKGKGPCLDVVLLDWEMPVMDGLTCVREIRTLEKSQHFTVHLEVIAVTANVRAEQVRIADEAGMDALLPKPFVIADLLDLITSRLKR